MGIPRNQKVYGVDVQLVPPSGCARKPVPDREPRAAEDVLAGLPWRRVAWRKGTKGRLAARFARLRIRVAAKPEVCAGDGAVRANNRRLPGEEVWLVGGWRSSGERRCCLSNLPRRASTRALAAAIKARRVCEQAHQQLKGELGLGHFEGRSWTRLHRHALTTCIACACLQHLRLAGQNRTGWGELHSHVPGPPPTPSVPAVRRAVVGRLFAPFAPPMRCPCCKHQLQPSFEPKGPR